MELDWVTLVESSYKIALILFFENVDLRSLTRIEIRRLLINGYHYNLIWEHDENPIMED